MEYRNTHANSSFKKVHYSENPESHEEIVNRGDNIMQTSEISKSSAKFSGDANSEISVDTSILDVEDDEKSLRRKLEDCEYRIRYLENENKQINGSLLDERNKNSKLEKKLQFVKDNQEIFMRLKEAYINMKYNEAAGRKMIEIREKSVQTWEGTICSSCIESEEMRRQIDITLEKYSEMFVVSPGEMEHLLNTVKYLKDLINRREERWALNMEREHKLQTRLDMLEDENTELKNIASYRENRCLSYKETAGSNPEQKLLEEKKLEDMQKFIETVNRDLDKLKKIIVKYEKKFREIKEHLPARHVSPLNEKEIKIVQQIVAKYNSKVQRKTAEGIVRSISPSNISDRAPQSHRPSSPIRGSRDNSKSRTKSPEKSKLGKKFDQNAESAIMMMDCLFE